jgi:superfamily II DNA or RNA helicase
MPPIPQGQFVRLVHDAARVGITTGASRPNAGRFLIGIRFPGRVEFVPQDQVELVPTADESPVSLLETGRLAEPARLRQVLTHIRLTGRLADLIYSMEATNTDFLAYQFKPVLKILNAPAGGLLIADEVGLGKTIEAGLIWTELRARYDCQRLLVLCPKTLRAKWREELLTKFGINAQIFDAAGLCELLKDTERAARGFAAICSMQGLRPPKGWDDESDDKGSARWRLSQYLAAQADEPLIDLLVIDEAHHLRNPETLLHQLGRLLRAVASHAVFLSATPIHLSNRDLFAQLSLLDPITFARQEALAEILEANRPLIKARDAILRPQPDAAAILTLLEGAACHPLLHGNQQLKVIISEITEHCGTLNRPKRAEIAAKLEQANLLAHAVTRTRRRDVEELRVERIVAERTIPLSQVEAHFYHEVTQEISRYAATLAVNERFLMATPQRMMSSCMAATLAHWLGSQPLEDVEDDDDDVDSDEPVRRPTKFQPLIAVLVKAVRHVATVEALTAADTKYDQLLRALRDLWREAPDDKVIVFSSFKPTLNYLARRLAADGTVSELLHGSIDDDRSAVLARFAEPEGARLLLSSEVGSEGLDLQFARVIINYDLPWNPMKVEQRIGRVDRLGQKSPTVTVLSLLHEDTIDARIYERLYQRLELCKHALGDFEAVLGEQIRALTRDLLMGTLSSEQQARRIEDAAQALENLRDNERELEDEAAGLIAHGDFILRAVKAAHELNRWMTGTDIHRYVRDYLLQYYPGCTIDPVSSSPDLFEISLTPKARAEFTDFIRARRGSQDTRLAREASSVRCRFTPALTRPARDRIELISQLHPLTRFVAAKLDEGEAPKLRPAIAARLMRSALLEPAPDSGRYLVAVMRWSLGGTSEVEKLAYAGIRLNDRMILEDDRAEILALATASFGTSWPEAADQVDCGTLGTLCQETLILGQLQAGFTRFEEGRQAENEDRAAIQLRTLERHRREQTDKLEEISQRHRAAGRDSLVRATRGRIDALNARCDQRRSEIERRRQLNPSTEDIAVLLVEVT